MVPVTAQKKLLRSNSSQHIYIKKTNNITSNNFNSGGIIINIKNQSLKRLLGKYTNIKINPSFLFSILTVLMSLPCRLDRPSSNNSSLSDGSSTISIKRKHKHTYFGESKVELWNPVTKVKT